MALWIGIVVVWLVAVGPLAVLIGRLIHRGTSSTYQGPLPDGSVPAPRAAHGLPSLSVVERGVRASD
jgi:hypothetical protein